MPLWRKYESNPFLKGKTLVSTSAKQEYDRAVSARDHYHDLMKKEGVSGRNDFEKQDWYFREIWKLRLPKLKIGFKLKKSE